MSDIFEEIYPPGYQQYGAPRSGNGAVVAPTRKPDPKKEYVAAGYAYGNQQTPKLLSTTVDEIVRDHGPRIYEAMDRDPACRSAKLALKLGIVAGGMDLAPAEKPEAGVKERTPDETLAEELKDFLWRNVERCPDFDQTVFDLLEACRTGVRLAEYTLELAKDGPDSGKLVLKSLRVKPNDLWQFVVDDYNGVIGVQAGKYGADRATYPPDKFVWLSWEPRDHDPRGTSVYHAAHEAWNLKVRTFPQLFKYLVQFGSPSLVGKTAPGEVDRAELDPVTGVETGDMVSPQEFMAQQLAHFQNGSVLAIPAEADVIPIQPTGNGEAFHRAIDLFDRQITHAILGTTSATMEAEHDSRAKGETGQDIIGLKIELGRKALAAALRGLFRRLITLNYGEDVAARLTPLVTFGQTDAQNRAEQWSAAASLGFQIGDSQLDEFDAMLGLPTRDREADEAKAKQAADEAMERQAALKPPPGDGAPPPKGKGNGKPKAKPAEFALDATPPGPWHDADITAARGLLSNVMPSGAALKRWEAGTETPENRRVLLSYLVDDCKSRLRADGEALRRELAAVDPDAPAEFAGPWETVARWRDGVARTLRRFYLAGALALLGPGEFSPDEWDTLRQQNNEQLDYLDGFAGDVVARRQARDGTLVSRSGMYGDAVWVVSMAVERTRMVGLGRTQEHSWLGASKDSCGRDDASELSVPSCRQEQAKGWQPIGTLSLPGGRKCKGACKCHMEYR